MNRILDWIGFTADIASLKIFFSQKDLKILAAWESLNATAFIRGRRNRATLDVLLDVHLSIRDQAPWESAYPGDSLSSYLGLASNRLATLINSYPRDQFQMDGALRSVIEEPHGLFPLSDVESPTQLINQLIAAGASL
jgi:hypothetical protein